MRAGRTARLCLIAAALIALVSACSNGAGSAETTLRDGAVLAQQVVGDSSGQVPVEWILAKDAETNRFGHCDDTVDTGPDGRAQWTYGFAYDLTKTVPNDELLDLLAPTGDSWILQFEDSGPAGGSAKIYQYAGDGVTLRLSLNGESATRPRVAFDGTSECIRNGDTGPDTFDAPEPPR